MSLEGITRRMANGTYPLTRTAVGTRDARLVPECSRALGARVEAGGEHQSSLPTTFEVRDARQDE